MQNSGNPYGMTQQNSCGQNNFGQPMQQDPFAYNQQQQNSCSPNVQPIPGNPCLCPPGIGQSHMIPCNSYLPQNILEQIRNCVGNTAPIFILPNSHPIQSQHSQIPQNPSTQVPVNIGYPYNSYPPSIGIGYPGPPSTPYLSPPCYPFPVPLPFYDPFGSQNRSQSDKNSTVCNCCRRNSAGNNSGQLKNPGTSSSSCEENETHRCSPGSDDAICTKANCPASVNLQALASQLLSIQGVIPCAATRLVLRKVPGSNVTTTVEDTMERAQKSIGSLKKEQLITEARNAQQVNGLINLHMMANPPQNIIPVLTMLQLKVNSLKALVENLVNKSVIECQSVGADGNTNLEPTLLAMKSDPELRELLATLRQKECEERVNVNYAPYHSQRVVAESRLGNFQNKINQVEVEMERRRTAAMPWENSAGQFHQPYFSVGGNSHLTLREFQCNGAQGFNPAFNATQVNDAGSKGFESPSSFMVQIRNPRRLDMKPNVGGPQTTYQSSEEQNLASPEAFAVSKLDKDTEECSGSGKSCSREAPENAEPCKEASDHGNGGTEGKKKLKIHIDETGKLSVKKESLKELEVGKFVELSPEFLVVIDKDGGEKRSKKNMKKKKNDGNEKRGGRNKSAHSIPSDSTCDSEASVSSMSSQSAAEEKEPETRLEKRRGKSTRKNILKGKKKTTTSENDKTESVNHDLPEPIDEIKPWSIKKEKHVNVAMLSELCYDHLTSNQEIDSRGSESTSLLEDHRSSEDDLGSRIIEENCVQKRLDVIRENADARAMDSNFETVYISKSRNRSNDACSIMRDASNDSISYAPKLRTEKSRSISIKPRRNWSKSSSRTSMSFLKEAQSQTLDGCINSVDLLDAETPREKISSYRDNKENVLADPRRGTCSIVSKKGRDHEILTGSISSMDRDYRKRLNYRFK